MRTPIGNRGNSAVSKYQLRRQSLPEALAESLRERILNGEFKDGDPLVQDAIATEYDCSRMPVREAFRQLEASGLIVSKMHKGSIVRSLPPTQILELFELRAILECDMIGRAIDAMSPNDIAHSEAILAELEDAYRQRDISRWGALNWEFHHSLYQPADRVQTMAVVQGINLQTDRYIRLQLLLTDAFADAEQEHREILRLCVERRTGEAIPYLRRHILAAGRNLVAAMISRRSADSG